MRLLRPMTPGRIAWAIAYLSVVTAGWVFYGLASISLIVAGYMLCLWANGLDEHDTKCNTSS
jgi:hypothetical protein